MGHTYLYRALLLIVAAWFLIILFFSAPNLFRKTNMERKLKERNERIDALIRDKQKMFFRNGTLKHHFKENMTVHKEPIHVCYSADAHTVLGLVASMYSVQTHTKHPVHFHVLVEQEIEADFRLWVAGSKLKQSQIDINVFDVKLVEKLVKASHETTDLMTYARFFYAEMFPKLSGKVIHLDTDTIVQGDIWELLKTKLSGHMLAVSGDCQSAGKHFTSYKPQYNSYLNFNEPLIQSQKLNATECTFSSGVYVLDIDRWRRENITQKLCFWMELNTKHDLWGTEKGGSGALPPMLIVFHQDFSLLNPMWHVRHLGWRVRQIFSRNFIQHAKLLHWSGRHKPWEGRSQLTDLWDQYYLPDPQGKYRPVRKAGPQLA